MSSKNNYLINRDAKNVGVIGKVICLLCGRHKFNRPQPHLCTGGFRKRGLRWFIIKCHG